MVLYIFVVLFSRRAIILYGIFFLDVFLNVVMSFNMFVFVFVLRFMVINFVLGLVVSFFIVVMCLFVKLMM